MNAFPEGSRRFSKLPRFTVWAVICALLLPAPVMTAGSVRAASSDAESWNRHVHERLNSRERAAAVVKMHEEFVKNEGGERHARGEGGEMIPPPSPLALSPSTPHTGAGDRAAFDGTGIPQMGVQGNDSPAGVSKGQSPLAAGGIPDSTRPQSLTEVLFNYGAGFMGVPGLAPRRGVDGSLDEGLGFHQDGTARKAGGVAGASGPSDKGQRAREYMRSGLQAGDGPYASGLAEPGYDPAAGMHWRGDPARGGRVSASGSNGGGYSRELGDFDPLNMAIDRGLNWGAGFVNSMGEAAISGLVDGGRARLNFRLDKDGYFSGEGDALLPFYDGTHTTIYTQLGARSMHDSSDTRWIGNFGLGQRWFPFAQGEDVKSADYDAGTLMLGYNAFFDYDLTRDHQRGGIGAEAQWDWFRLASNYYFPLSGWKGSEDFDSAFVEERAAEGWDARIKAYLPFYRNVALTGAYSQWFGDHVGMFGHENLEKDPKVWSYGVEYTPIPLVSGFVTQKSTERGRTDTEFGLNFTWHFGMSWDDQTSHSKVAELRTVGGSRHEFVDRENRIILEYKARNAYHIEYLGPDGARGFLFRIRDGFGEYKAGQTVRVTASGNYLADAAPSSMHDQPASLFARAVNFLDGLISVKAAYAADLSRTYTTDGQGRFWVQLDSSAPAQTSVIIQAGNNEQTFVLAGGGGGSGYSITLSASPTNPTVSASSTLTATVTRNGSAVAGENVTFTWVVTESSQSAQSGGSSSTNAGGEATYTHTGDGSRRTVTVTAMLQSDSSKTATADVQFGDALSNGFIALASSTMNWNAAGSYCASQGGKLPLINGTTLWDGGGSVNSIDGFGTGSWPSGLAAAGYWTGTEFSSGPRGGSWIVAPDGGDVWVSYVAQTHSLRVACVR